MIDRAGRVRPRHKRSVNSQRNIAGQPPLQLAYLRIFDNQPRARTSLQGAWRELGYVYMLRGASSVTPRELRDLRRTRRSDFFNHSATELQSRLQHAKTTPQRPGRRVFCDLAPKTIRTRDRYGGYPPVAVLCHGSFWREAVDELLQHVDAVCMDLSGFTRRNEGTAYELQRIVDRFPIERVLYLDGQPGRPEVSRACHHACALGCKWRRVSAQRPALASDATQLAKTDRYNTITRTNDRGAEDQPA